MQQLTLLPQTTLPDDFTTDDYETPDNVARLVANHVHDGSIPGLPKDQIIVEAGAGSGQIAQFLPPGSICVEAKGSRVRAGKLKAPHCTWYQDDFLTWSGIDPGTVDLVVGNPPFSTAADFLNRAFELIHSRGRVVFLLPCDTLHKPDGFLGKVQHHFTHSVRPVVGRVSYLRNGKPVRGRQIYDSVFTFWTYPEPNPVLLWQNA